MWEKICAGMLGAMMLTGSAAGLSANTVSAAPAAETTAQPAQEQKVEQPLKISINLAARSLALYQGSTKIRLYPIAPGTAYTPTPTGYYKIREKEVNPTWTDPATGYSIPSGPDCPLGYRWMTVTGNIGIHGTNNPASIGTYASHGCMRMFEKDVEALYDLVEVGTPVEITYNRVVVEKAPDDTVVYYIYPDGYGWQKLSVADVYKWLAGYGVGNFESDEDIQAKINASDGNPTYIGKVYPLYVNGKKLANNAVSKDGVTYLPAIDLANATNINLGWDAATKKLISTLGSAEGVDKRDVLYCKADDTKTLFNLTGSINDAKQFVLTSAVEQEAPKAEAPKAETPEVKPEEKTAEAPKQVEAEQPKADDKAVDGSKSKKSLKQIYKEATKK